MKNIISAMLAVIMMFSMAACGENVSENESIVASTDENVSSAETTETDPFLVEDGIQDSTEDIVIDIYEFIEEKNTEHKAIVQNYSEISKYKQYAADFYDTLNMVSPQEAALLLNTKQRDMSAVCTKEAALNDMDLLFRLFESFYGLYDFYGGKAVFDAAQVAIEEKISSMPDVMTLDMLSQIISENMTFVTDRHMDIGWSSVCKRNNTVVGDYYIDDLYFYEDDIGYYTKINDRKWYIDSVQEDAAVEDYLKITIDDKGQLCYMILLSVSAVDERLNSSYITLTRGDREATLEIEWKEFGKRQYYDVGEVITLENNIPLLNVDFNLEGKTSGDQQYAQMLRLRSMGPALLRQDVFIYDFNSGSGCQSLFDSLYPKAPEIFMYKLSNTANYLGRWNMPWSEGSLGRYAVKENAGRWVSNDTFVFVVQDKNNFSAAEGSIADIKAMENVITVGGSTGGTLGPSGATNQWMTLPQTGLYVSFGATMAVYAGYTEDGFCAEPDIWVNLEDSVDAVYRMCKWYGIQNNADTSVLGIRAEGRIPEEYTDTEVFENTTGSEGSSETPGLKHYVDIDISGYNPEQGEEVKISRIMEEKPWEGSLEPMSTVFSCDMDKDGTDEEYVFGIRVKHYPEGVVNFNEYIEIDEESSHAKMIFPFIWSVQEDGTLAEREDMVDMLTDIEMKLWRVDDFDSTAVFIPTPFYESVGCTHISIRTKKSGSWVYEVSGFLCGEKLMATSSSTFSVV